MMRPQLRSCLQLAVVAIIVLFLVTGVSAQREELPLQCTTHPHGKWTITAQTGSSGEFPARIADCSESTTANGLCADYIYEVTPNDGKSAKAEIIVIGMRAGQEILRTHPASPTISDPCDGDSRTGFLHHACHEFTVKFDTESRQPKVQIRTTPSAAVLTTVAVANQHKSIADLESCAIAGPGTFVTHEFQPVMTTEIMTFKDCSIEFTKNEATGDILKAKLTKESEDKGCQFPFNGTPIRDFELRNQDTEVSLGLGKYGEGTLSVGEGSCSCRFIAGRGYCFGNPCPE